MKCCWVLVNEPEEKALEIAAVQKPNVYESQVYCVCVCVILRSLEPRYFREE